MGHMQIFNSAGFPGTSGWASCRELLRCWAGRIVRTFVCIHLLAVDRPEFSFVQICDVAIGRDVFQIGEKCPIRRCGGDFENHRQGSPKSPRP